MKRKYSKLRGLMYERCIFQSELLKILDKSQTYLTNRLAGSSSFTVEEAYKILDFLHIPHEQFIEYFPPNGNI